MILLEVIICGGVTTLTLFTSELVVSGAGEGETLVTKDLTNFLTRRGYRASGLGIGRWYQYRTALTGHETRRGQQ